MSNIDRFLNQVIKFLLVFIICIMLTIGFLFVTPVYVHAESGPDPLPSFSSAPTANELIASGFLAGIGSDGRGIYCGASNDSTFVGWSGSGTTFSYASTSAGTIYRCYSDSNSINSQTLSQNSNFGLYYTSLSNSKVPSGGFYGYQYSDINDFINYVKNYVPSSGEFYNFPQFDDDTYITYEFIEGNGVMVYASPNTYYLMGTYSSSDAPLSQYCYINNGENDTSFAVFSSVPLTVYSAFLNGGTYSYGVCSQYDTNKYYYVFPETIVSNIENSFDSLESAQDAFTGASSGQGSGVSPAGELTLQVPAGNVLYVRPRSGSLARLDVRYPYLSNSFGNPFPLSAYWVSGVSSLPDENTTFPISGMSQINWSVDTSNVNGYGQSYNGYTTHAPFNAGWFVVYNPTYYFMTDTDGHNVELVSPTITVKMQFASEYHIYDLSMNLISNSSSSNTGFETELSGSYDDATNQWDKTSTTGSDTPSVGGQQQEIVAAQDFSVSEYLHQIRDTLSSFASDFVQLLSSPIVFISNLIDSGTAFMSSISQFFTWLPAPIYTLIISALGVAVVIGIFKLLF